MACPENPEPVGRKVYRPSGKGWLYEGGIGVPGPVRLPGVVPAGSVSAAVMTASDWLRTICETAGVPPPQIGLDGASIWPSSREGSRPRRCRDHCSGAFLTEANWGSAPRAAVREGDRKLIEWFEDGREKLYDLAADPSETRKRSAEVPQRSAAVQERLHAWQKDGGALMATPNPAYDQSRPNGRQ